MRIPDYPRTTTLDQSNMFLLDGDNGTQSIQSKDLSNALLSTLTTQELLQHVDLSELPEAELGLSDNLLIGTADGTNNKIRLNGLIYKMLDIIDESPSKRYSHRSIWRGKNLGTYVTDKQYAAIADGSFDDLFVGDYWWGGQPTDHVWRIVDIDYWWNTGQDKNCRIHHLVIMPDGGLFSSKMNETDDNSTGWINSKCHQELYNRIYEIISGYFTPDHQLVHQELLNNSMSNGIPSGNIWIDSFAELPNEQMILGYRNLYGSKYSDQSNLDTIDNKQLIAFALNPDLKVVNRQNAWLRDAVKTSDFSIMYGNGAVGAAKATHNYTVRPVFGIY